MSSSTRARLALALIAIVPVFWATNYLIARSAPGVIAPNTLAGLRWTFAGGAFCLLAWREIRAHCRAILADWRHMLVLGTLGMWICGSWVYIAGQSTSATNLALIYALSPVMIVLVSRLWLKEPFSRPQALGVLLSLAGVVHVVIKGQWAQLARVEWVAGDLWVLAATLSWTFFTILLKRWGTPLTDPARLGVISFFGVLVILPFAVWEAATGPLPAFSAQGVALALVAAALPGFAAYLGYAFMLRELGAARVGVTLYLGPPYAAVLAWLVLGEPIRAYHAVGLLLILPGVWLVNRAQAQAR
jgi:drug/metabolite transporter (DMT)-like permease